MRRLALAAVAAALSGIGASDALAAGGYAITDLGTLGGTYSEANAISESGLIVGRSSLAGGFPYHAVLWTGGPPIDLGTLGGTVSDASGVNDAGQVVGTSTTTAGPSYHRAFLYDGGPLLDLGTLGGSSSFGWGINGAGTVVGGADLPSFPGRRAFRYSGAVMTDLGTLVGDSTSSAQAINDVGVIVGNSGAASESPSAFAYYPLAGAMVDLGTYGGLWSFGVDVNDEGDFLINVVTSIVPGMSHAVIDSAGTTITLGTLGGNFAQATGFNNHGQVVGLADVSFNFHGFLFTGGEMLDVNTLLPAGSGWTIAFANDINDAGQIVGLGVHNGQSHAYLLTPNTAAGANVVVQPVDSAAGATPVTLTFTNVSVPGGTTLTTSSSGSPPPAGFTLGAPPTYYELATTASFAGSIEVCIDATGIDFGGAAPELFHYENAVWVDVTTSVSGAVVCGSVGSLSPFALFAPEAPAYEICPLYDASKVQRSGRTIPIKLQLCDEAGANRSSPQVALHATEVVLVSSEASGPIEDSGNANPDSDFRYDATLGGTGGYIFNLSTGGLATGTYAVLFTVGEQPHVYKTHFQIG